MCPIHLRATQWQWEVGDPLEVAASVDLRLDVDLDVSDSWERGYAQYRKAGYQSIDVHARGMAVSPIDGGLFDVDQLIALQ